MTFYPISLSLSSVFVLLYKGTRLERSRLLKQTYQLFHSNDALVLTNFWYLASKDPVVQSIVSLTCKMFNDFITK